jgi:hypothetical protein
MEKGEADREYQFQRRQHRRSSTVRLGGLRDERRGLIVKPQAIIYGRQQGAPYHPLLPIAAEIVSLFSKAFDVKVADDEGSLLALEGVNLVVGLDDRWTEPLNRTLLNAVESWVRRGGTLLLVHNGICWARDPRWRRLAGGRFTGHGPAKDLTFTRQSDGAQFTLFEEPYRFSTPLFSGNHVIVTYQDEGKTWPAFWSRKVGRGTIAYALPGHGIKAFLDPIYRNWLSNMATKALKAK